MYTTQSAETRYPYRAREDLRGALEYMPVNYQVLSRLATQGMSNVEIADRLGIRREKVVGLRTYYGILETR